MKLLKIFTCSVLFGLPVIANAQDDIDIYLEAGLDDAKILTESYISPIMKGFGYGINNGWYNTAKAHKTLGFDLTFSAQMVFVPKSSEYFKFNNDDYNNIRLGSGESDQLSTAFGPADDGPEIDILGEADVNGNREVVGSFNAIGGLGIKDEIGMNLVPVPMAQLGIGIVKNTDLKIRFIPSIDLGDAKVNLWGFGVMHDVKQWIPGMKHLPFDLSALVAYTKMSSSYNLQDVSDTGDGKQELLLSASGLTIQGLISKKFSVLTLYGALGYNKINSSVNVNGTYEVEDGTTFVDPIDLSFGEGSLRATAGFRLKLAIVTLHADYTINKYPILSAGLGFSVR